MTLTGRCYTEVTVRVLSLRLVKCQQDCMKRLAAGSDYVRLRSEWLSC